MLRVIGLSHVLLVCSTWARKETGHSCHRIDTRIVFADTAIYFNLVSALLETSYKTTCSHFFGNSLIYFLVTPHSI